MKMVKFTFGTFALSLVSASAFANTTEKATTVQPSSVSVSSPVSVPSPAAQQIVKPAVLIDASPNASGVINRRIVRVIKEPVEMPIARDASTTDGSPFIFKYGKNTNTKTYRPSKPKSETMPNLFKK